MWYSERRTPLGWSPQITPDEPSEKRAEGRVKLRHIHPVPEHLEGRRLSEIRDAIVQGARQVATDNLPFGDTPPWPLILDSVAKEARDV